jgi:Fur family transcriptional regulator, zinc uptake regulator
MEHDLTRNQQLVFDAVQKAGAPLSAYTLLDQLREHGLKAPLQIYRALDKLVAQGKVHKLESINAFVACKHDHVSDQSATIFMICDSCGTVAECSNACLNGDLREIATSNAFVVAKTNIEIHGKCGKC